MKNLVDELVKEQMQKIVVYKSHKLKNDFISVTYATKGDGYVTTMQKKEVRDFGGAKTSIALYLVHGENI